MKKRNALFFSLIILLVTKFSFAQTTPQVEIPLFNDKYCNYIKKLEAGQIEIDYQDFRFSFIESKQFKVLNEKSTVLDSLKNEMYSQMDKSNYQELINLTKKMLSIDYTNMMAHKVLRQTYKAIGDTINAAKYKSIQFGLLNSIVKKGDGASCSTAWSVIKIEEEYFILNMLGAKLKKQSINNDGGLCDKMEVKTKEGEEKTYYFEVSKVFEGYKK